MTYIQHTVSNEARPFRSLDLSNCRYPPNAIEIFSLTRKSLFPWRQQSPEKPTCSAMGPFVLWIQSSFDVLCFDLSPMNDVVSRCCSGARLFVCLQTEPRGCSSFPTAAMSSHGIAICACHHGHRWRDSIATRIQLHIRALPPTMVRARSLYWSACLARRTVR